MEAVAVGYVLKDASKEDLAAVIRSQGRPDHTVLAGGEDLFYRF